MTPKEKRNALLAEKLVGNLKQRHYEAFFCHTAQEAVEKITGMIPEGSSVTWGGSMTIRDMGLTRALHNKEGLDIWDRDLAPDREAAQEIYRRAFYADYYLSSVNAMSEDGEIVNIDGNGNRVAALTWGPKHVVYIVGINKICQDLDAAVKRARSTAAPVNAQRFNLNTPCKADGVCHNCQSPDSICNYIWIQRLSPNHRHTVILVAEDLGY